MPSGPNPTGHETCTWSANWDLTNIGVFLVFCSRFFIAGTHFPWAEDNLNRRTSRPLTSEKGESKCFPNR